MIWRLKLAETFLTPSDSAWTALREPVREPILLGGLEVLDPDLEARVGVRPGELAATLDDRVVRAGCRRRVPDLRERDGVRRRERHLDAALEVDPEVEAPDDEEQHGEADRDQRDDEVEAPAGDDVDPLPARDLARGRPHEARALRELEAGEEAEHRAGRRDGGEQ